MIASGCGDNDDSGDGDRELRTISPGRLTVGSDIPYRPFEFGRPPYQGFDVDIVNQIGRRLKLDVELVKTPFDTIIDNLAQQKFDLVASALTITHDREKTVNFSQPYFQADQSLIVNKGS